VRALVLGVTLVAAAIAAANASGGQPVTQPLNPPAPSFYTCMATGNGTICHGTEAGTHFAAFDGSCPQGFDILENGYTEVNATRYYDGDGNLIRELDHQQQSAANPLNVLYNSLTGKSTPYSQDYTITEDFAVPGDFSSVTTTINGKIYMATLPGDGMLVHDVGVLAFAPDGSVLTEHGPKLLFNSQTDELCALLAS
jgi:hypothetical protein